MPGGYVRVMGADELVNGAGPRYLQIAAVVEREIRGGMWLPGNVAPSRPTLAQRFGVAGETARRAQMHLVSLGFLVPVPGIGMIVTAETMWPERD